MKALVFEPFCEPYEKEIENTLESMQKEVGGYIETCYPFDEPIVIICDEEGKLKGGTPNRAIIDDDGDIIDIICGTFFAVRFSEDDFADICDSDRQCITDKLKLVL